MAAAAAARRETPGRNQEEVENLHRELREAQVNTAPGLQNRRRRRVVVERREAADGYRLVSLVCKEQALRWSPSRGRALVDHFFLGNGRHAAVAMLGFLVVVVIWCRTVVPSTAAKFQKGNV